MDQKEQAEQHPDGSLTAKRTLTQTMTWVGYATALIGLGGSLLGGIHWVQQRRQHQAEFTSRMAVSQALLSDGEYKASVQSYNVILKDDPLNKAALDAQLGAASEWAENFHAVIVEGQKASDVAGPDLDSILAILNAGLARAGGSQSSGTQVGDVRAHIGWTHWLKQHIAEQEFGSAAKDNFTAALKADPSNVYAHAMFGNYLLMTGESLPEAVAHFNAALASSRGRPLVRGLVRRLQLGGLFGRNLTPGARAEMVRAANDMRKGGESISDAQRKGFLYYCFNPPYTQPDDLKECLTALPQDQAWQTFLWLDNGPREGSSEEARTFTRSYIEAFLSEVSGNKPAALEQYKALLLALQGKSSTLEYWVKDAITRLSDA